jgi:hypothetical protein
MKISNRAVTKESYKRSFLSRLFSGKLSDPINVLKRDLVESEQTNQIKCCKFGRCYCK